MDFSSSFADSPSSKIDQECSNSTASTSLAVVSSSSSSSSSSSVAVKAIDDGTCIDGCPCKLIPYKTSIFTAAANNDYNEIVRHISRKRKNLITLTDDYGYGPLHYASRKNHINVVNLLLQNGFQPDYNKCGATPLLRASYAGSYECCLALLAAGADVNAVDTSFNDKRTSLHKAYSRGHDSIISLLISYGADVDKRDACGSLPIEVYKSDSVCDDSTDINCNKSFAVSRASDDTSRINSKSIINSGGVGGGVLCARCLQKKLSFKKTSDGVLVCTYCYYNEDTVVCLPCVSSRL